MCFGSKVFWRRNGHPHQRSTPTPTRKRKALIERFHIDPGQLPIVLCPGGQLLRNPERGRARPLHRSGAADRSEPRL